MINNCNLLNSALHTADHEGMLTTSFLPFSGDWEAESEFQESLYQLLLFTVQKIILRIEL